MTKTNGATVVKYTLAKEVYVEFDSGSVLRIQVGHLRRGNFKDIRSPTIFGRGFNGGTVPLKEKNTIYRHWYHMFERCYSDISNDCYEGCSVAPIWYDYQNFKTWYEFEIGDKAGQWEIDKDLVYPGNMVYSPENCELIPRIINNLIRVGTCKVREGLNTGVVKEGAGFRATVCKRYLGLYSSNSEAFKVYCDEKNKVIRKMATKYSEQLSSRAYLALSNYDFRHYEGEV